jgi:hypothetical protein
MPNNPFPKIYFNTPHFLRQVLPPQPPVFDFLKEDETGKAFIRFSAENGVFRSPFKATFGGFERLGDYNPTLLQTLFAQIETKARELHCSQISITQSPDCYLSEPSVLAQAYTTAGYQIAYTDTNFHIPITSLPYSKLLHSRTAQRVRQQVKIGYNVVVDLNPDLAWYYEQVQHNRHSKGRPLNQSEEAFTFAIQKNPESYLIFKVQNAVNECLAFSICTLLGNSLYTFYTVNLAEGEILNPLYLLHQQLYNYCQENNIALLDLGIATDKGVENVGLINFKKQLGAIPTKKITWIKYIS